MTIDFIPVSMYGAIFYYVIFLLMARAVIQCSTGRIYTLNQSPENRWIGKILVLWMIVYIGCRPISGVFVDTVNYAADFAYKDLSGDTDWLSHIVSLEGDFIFGALMAWCVKYADVHFMFLVCALVYVGCSFLVCKKIFGNQWVTPFIVVCSMASFWAYGVNTVRNGMAASLVMLALAYRDKWKTAILFAFLGVGIHKSLLLIVVVAIISEFFKNTKWYIAGWFACIISALVFGERLSNAIASNPLIRDQRLESYMEAASDQVLMSYFSKTGFRWDFLLYSALPICVGYFFIYKKRFNDPFYRWILNIYICANSFWICMMYAAYNDRFAQLSWFMMGIILIYPFFKKRFWVDQEKKLACFLILIYGYSFYSNIVLPFFSSSQL